MSKGGLSVKAIDGELLPEEMTYQQTIRSAMFDGVSAADAKEIVAEIVKKAKSGDKAAQKMFFEYLAGFGTAPTKVTVVQQFGSVAEAAEHERQTRRAKCKRETAG